MAGTPPKVVTRSRSISSSARPASHFRMITIFPPKARLATRIEWQPVAWKKGTDSRDTFWPAAARVRPAPSRPAARPAARACP